MTIKEFISIMANELGVAPPKFWIPIRCAYPIVTTFEFLSKMINFKPPVHIQKIILFTKNRIFTTRKAETELGYIPKTSVKEGLHKTIGWYLENSA